MAEPIPHYKDSEIICYEVEGRTLTSEEIIRLTEFAAKYKLQVEASKQKRLDRIQKTLDRLLGK